MRTLSKWALVSALDLSTLVVVVDGRFAFAYMCVCMRLLHLQVQAPLALADVLDESEF
jgi:hypothetical protein